MNREEKATQMQRKGNFDTRLLNLVTEMNETGVWETNLIAEFTRTMRAKFDADPDGAEGDLAFWKEAHKRATPLS